jgi:hypothetical protein
LVFRKALVGIYRYAAGFLFPVGLREVQRAWHLAAAELLKRRYGIDPPERGSGDDWGVWYSVLGKPKPEHARGSLLVVASHATGWCGIAATHFSPALNTGYYVRFSLLLILCGVIHDWYVAKWRHDPILSGIVRVRLVLDELREGTSDRDLPGSSNGTDIGLAGDE